MNHKLVKIDVFSDSMEANLLKGELESKGIKCFLKNDAIIGSTGLNFTYGGIELLVSEEDVEAAKRILDNIDN